MMLAYLLLASMTDSSHFGTCSTKNGLRLLFFNSALENKLESRDLRVDWFCRMVDGSSREVGFELW